jgi:hypothetical protein
VYSALEHLARSVYFSRYKDSYLAMFTAYFDASGTPKTSVLTMAGFVGRIKKWTDFESDWRGLLPAGVTMFHMTDFASSKSGWEAWKGPEHSERRVRLIQKLSACIKRTVNKGFVHSVRRKHFMECDKEYRLRDRFKNQYVFLGMGCLGKLEIWAENKKIKKDKILCVFEDGDKGIGQLIALARSEGFNAVPQSKKDVRAFDACDLAAWKLRTVIDDAWEKELHMAQPDAADRILKSLGVVENLVRDPRAVGMYSLRGIREVCRLLNIPKR